MCLSKVNCQTKAAPACRQGRQFRDTTSTNALETGQFRFSRSASRSSIFCISSILISIAACFLSARTAALAAIKRTPSAQRFCSTINRSVCSRLPNSIPTPATREFCVGSRGLGFLLYISCRNQVGWAPCFGQPPALHVACMLQLSSRYFHRFHIAHG